MVDRDIMMHHQPTIIGVDVHDKAHAMDLISRVIRGELKSYPFHYPPANYEPQPGDVWIYRQIKSKSPRWVDKYTWTPSSTSGPPSKAVAYSTCKQVIKRFSRITKAAALKTLDSSTRRQVDQGILRLEHFSEKGSILYHATRHLVRKRLKWRVGDKMWILVAYGQAYPKPQVLPSRTKSARKRAAAPSRRGSNTSSTSDSSSTLSSFSSKQDEQMDGEGVGFTPNDVGKYSFVERNSSCADPPGAAGPCDSVDELSEKDSICTGESHFDTVMGTGSPWPSPPSSLETGSQANMYEYYPEYCLDMNRHSDDTLPSTDADTVEHALMGRTQAAAWLEWMSEHDPVGFTQLLAMIPFLE